MPKPNSTNNNIVLPSAENGIVSSVLFFLLLLIVLFAVISKISPLWLQQISEPGKTIEAISIKDLGDEYLREGKYREAERQYLGCLKVDPEMVDAITNLGITYVRTGQYKNAVSTFLHALSKNPDMPDVVYHNLADTYERLGNYEQAIIYYKKAAQLAPFPIFPYISLGKCYLSIQEWDSGIEALEMAYSNRSTITNSYVSMLKRDIILLSGKENVVSNINKIIENPISEIDLSNYDQEIFNQSLLHEHEIAIIYDKLGYAYAMKQEMDTAILYFNKSLSIWPNYENARNNLNAAMSN